VKYCCDDMEDSVEGKHISYTSEVREYLIRLPSDNLFRVDSVTFKYCPWCATALPKSLEQEWGEILENEYGIKEPIWDDADKVPEEFKTDEWWKKRGL
jgi:hypothetical protein